MRNRVSNTGPLLPGEASRIVRVVGWLIGLGGALKLLGIALLLLTETFGSTSIVFNVTTVMVLILATALGVVFCVAGLQLYQARRRGAAFAMGAVSFELLEVLFGAGRPSASDVLQPVAILVGVALAWPHLSESGGKLEEHVTVVPRKRE